MSLEKIVNNVGNIVDGFKKVASKLTKASLIAAALIAGGASYTNTAYAAGDNSTPAVTTTQQTEIYKGIEYTAITNEKGETIYVPPIATPQNIMKIIEEYKEIILHNINEHSNKEPIEELTIEPNLEEKLTTYLFLAAKNNGNATPKTLEELKQLEEKLGDPILLVYRALKVETKDGKTYLTPTKENERRYVYGLALKAEKPKEEYYCAVEGALIIRKTPEGKTDVETETKKRRMIYDEFIQEGLSEEGIDALGKKPYTILISRKPTEEVVATHYCVERNQNNPKQATIYFSPPIIRQGNTNQYANNN